MERTAEGDQIVSRRDVEVLYLEGELARVRGTLDAGDLVIADGTHRVVPGQRVESIRVGTTLEITTERGDLVSDDLEHSP